MNILILWIGDFGSSIDNPSNQIIPCPSNQEQHLHLTEHDQLKLTIASGNSRFSKFREMGLTFAPTACFLVGSKIYNRNESVRWSDRIIWKSITAGPVQQLKYAPVIDYDISQHRPVASTFSFKIQTDLSRFEIEIKHPSSWRNDQDQRVEYVIPRRFPIHDKDYIGLERGIIKVASVKSCPPKAEIDLDKAVTCNVTFNQATLCNLRGGQYRLFYFSYNLQANLGSNQKFELLDLV